MTCNITLGRAGAASFTLALASSLLVGACGSSETSDNSNSTAQPVEGSSTDDDGEGKNQVQAGEDPTSSVDDDGVVGSETQPQGDGDATLGGDEDGAGGVENQSQAGDTTSDDEVDSNAGSGGTSGAGGPPSQSECLPAGQLNCSDAAQCCDDSTCIADGDVVVCAFLCTGPSECASGCCAPLDEQTSVCAPAEYCPAAPTSCDVNQDCDTGCCAPVDADTSACAPASFCAPAPSVICSDLVVVANDGTYLGEATSNAFAVDGVCNEFSQYGSEFSATSIFNDFGTYGSQFSTLSAYNQFTTTPPVLYCISTDTVLNAVSKNTFVAGAIDPDFLCAVLAANGL
jgi:hypothetical protein